MPRSATAPRAAWAVNRVQPVREPAAWASAASSQAVADRPRTGVTTSAATTSQSQQGGPGGTHAPWAALNSTGRAPTARRLSCHSDSPNRNPIRARE